MNLELSGLTVAAEGLQTYLQRGRELRSILKDKDTPRWNSIQRNVQKIKTEHLRTNEGDKAWKID